jgi:hypothetical protein
MFHVPIYPLFEESLLPHSHNHVDNLTIESKMINIFSTNNPISP